MFQFQNPFDARTVEPSASFSPLPPADYKCIVTASEVEATADQQSGMLVLTMQVVEGQYQGRTVKWWLNIYNKSQQAQEIAYKQLSALCHVTGQFQIQNSGQLHNIPFIAVIGISSKNPQYNDVKGVKDLQGNSPGKPGTTGVGSGQPQAAPAQASFAMPPQQQPAPAYAPPAQAAPWGPPAPTAPPQAPAQTWPPPQAAAPQPPAGQAPWGPPPQQTAAPAPAQGAPPWGGQPQQTQTNAAPPPQQGWAPPAAAPPAWGK
jgi:hypothetical protein